MNIDPTIFRAYDIRGIVDKTLTPEVVEKIGQAIGTEARARGESTLLIARDGRISGPLFLAALSKGIIKSGCHVINLGAMPSPVLYFATYMLKTHSGVMVTGSHNPPEYNGIKVVLKGVTLVEDEIKALYDRIVNNELDIGVGEESHSEIIDQYIKNIVNHIKLKKKLRIVIDCGNGIGGAVAPQLFKALGCDVTELFSEVDGHFPNHPADPSIEANMQDLINKVKKVGADIGLAFDGDVDRLGVVTNKGDIIWPDRYLILFAEDMLSRNPGATVVYDVKCTRHLREEILRHGGKPVMSRTGHSFIKAKMQETGALLGGEMSGHVFFKERWYGFDDGIYAGVRLLEILAKRTETLAEIFDAIPTSINTPELKLPIDDDKKFAFMDRFMKDAKFAGGTLTTLDGLRVDYPDGWGLIRSSNTTPYLILRFEAKDEIELKRIQDLFRQELIKLDDGLELPF
ncbi:MAG: phosphoglucomutase [Gammaproteobacteria bacterium RIFCSPHIGHO2_02_FULL_42_13]|nr:MAG: phosphoglucomutase [Gammaproteobacteria bacterium RIFCSPHIGHO2_02_FULL_42_13]OGT70104.1 MAG: phosphoglucomutase [Gammaproteobacteria bacterium RIFCSPLOWO2_02_FULL_42_9]